MKLPEKKPTTPPKKTEERVERAAPEEEMTEEQILIQLSNPAVYRLENLKLMQNIVKELSSINMSLVDLKKLYAHSLDIDEDEDDDNEDVIADDD